MQENEQLTISIKKLSPTAQTPSYATVGAAGFDISSNEDVQILPNQRKAISTGISMEVPMGYELQVRGRSGLAFKHGIVAFNGTVDSDYRGEIKILLFNQSSDIFLCSKGDRIAQGVINKIETVEFEKVEQLKETVRNISGFGSTGK